MTKQAALREAGIIIGSWIAAVVIVVLFLPVWIIYFPFICTVGSDR